MVADIGFHAHSRFRCPVRRIRVQTAVQRDSSRCTAVTLFFPIRRLWHTSLPPPCTNVAADRRTDCMETRKLFISNWLRGNTAFHGFDVSENASKYSPAANLMKKS